MHTKSLAEVFQRSSHPGVIVVHLEWICILKEVVATMKKKLESGSELEVEDVKKSLEFSSTPQPPVRITSK